MENSTPFFTIIVAGHQCAPYLPKALSSMAAQTCADFEAICHVEESTDNSLAICQQMAAQDPRFTVVTAPKSGSASIARNYAIEHGRGKYLVVLDGDDWLAPDLLEQLRKKLDECGALDVVAYAALQTADDEVDWNDDEWTTNFTTADAGGCFSGQEALRRAARLNPYFNSHVCLNAYRLAFLRENHLRMVPGLRMEDYESIPRIIFAARRMAYIARPLYVYRRRPGSVTTGGSDKTFFDTFRQLNTMVRFALGTDVPTDIRSIWANQWLSFLQWLLFHPKTSRRRTDRDRRKAFELLLENDNAKNFRGLAQYATRPKRIAAWLLLLAAKGWMAPAKLFFRFFYYPLAERPRKINS